MKTIKDYFKNKEANILETLRFDLSGITAYTELQNSLSDYFDRYWYSDFDMYFTDKDGEVLRISLNCLDGYETDINLSLENELICSVNDVEEALTQIEKLIIKNN